MDTVSVIIKSENNLRAFCFNKRYLDRLLVNIRLYRKDLTFISEYVKEYSELLCDEFLPTPNGILFIDFDNDLIIDSQNVTAVNKVTPNEIKMSKHGNITDETYNNSIIHRFNELIEANYLKGFEEWCDNGHHLNKSVCSMSFDELMKMIMESSNFGQFVFKTIPFKIEMFGNDWEEQNKLFERIKSLGLLPKNSIKHWKKYLEGLK